MSRHQHVLAIPDSPPHRVRSPITSSLHIAQDHGAEEPKSESPELESQVYSVPPSNAGTPRADEARQTARAHDHFLKPSLPANIARTSHYNPSNNVIHSTSSHTSRLRTLDRMTPVSEREGRLARPNLPTFALSGYHRLKSPQERLQTRDIYDPIDTDESSQELPRLKDTERLKLHHTSPSGTPLDPHLNGLLGAKPGGSHWPHVDAVTMADLATTPADLEVNGEHLRLTSPVQPKEFNEKLPSQNDAELAAAPKSNEQPSALPPHSDSVGDNNGEAMILDEVSQVLEKRTGLDKSDATHSEGENSKMSPLGIGSHAGHEPGNPGQDVISSHIFKASKVTPLMTTPRSVKAQELVERRTHGRVDDTRRAKSKLTQKATENENVLQHEVKEPRKSRLPKDRKKAAEKKATTEQIEEQNAIQKIETVNESSSAKELGDKNVVTKKTKGQLMAEKRQEMADRKARDTAERLAQAVAAMERQTTGHTRHSSNTPISSDGPRKSATPIYPGKAVLKPSSLTKTDTNSSSWTPSRSTNLEGQMPLPNALRSTPIALRRSVSFAENPVAFKPGQGQGQGQSVTAPANGESKISSGPGAEAAEKHTEDSDASKVKDTVVSRKASKKPRDPPRKAVSCEMIQLKLDVTRDKGKGRVKELPPRPEPSASKEVVTVSDGDDSITSYYSESDKKGESANPKVGPSSTSRSDSNAAASNIPVPSKPEAWMKSLSVSIEPPEQAEDSEDESVMKSGSKAVARPPEDPHSRSNSSSRSPARYVSLSSSESESEEEKEADEKEASMSASASKSNSRSTSSCADETVSSSKSIASKELEGITPITASSNGPRSSRTSEASSTRSKESSDKVASKPSLPSEPTSTHSKSTSSEHGNSEDQAEQQLQRESRQSMEPSRSQTKVTPQTHNPTRMSHSTTDHSATMLSTPQGSRAAYARFPSLTGLKQSSARNDMREQSTRNRPGFLMSSERAEPQSRLIPQSNGITHGDESSASTEDSSSSEDDSDANGKSSEGESQISRKAQRKVGSGFGGLLKSMFQIISDGQITHIFVLF